MVVAVCHPLPPLRLCPVGSGTGGQPRGGTTCGGRRRPSTLTPFHRVPFARKLPRGVNLGCLNGVSHLSSCSHHSPGITCLTGGQCTCPPHTAQYSPGTRHGIKPQPTGAAPRRPEALAKTGWACTQPEVQVAGQGSDPQLHCHTPQAYAASRGGRPSRRAVPALRMATVAPGLTRGVCGTQ